MSGPTSGWNITSRMTAGFQERGLVDETEAQTRLLRCCLTNTYIPGMASNRRPADLTTPDYQQPMQTDLLWVYERP